MKTIEDYCKHKSGLTVATSNGSNVTKIDKHFCSASSFEILGDLKNYWDSGYGPEFKNNKVWSVKK